MAQTSLYTSEEIPSEKEGKERKSKGNNREHIK